MTNPYREKLLSITLGKPSDFSSRTQHGYWDSDALHTIFPEDAEEQMMEETNGQGPLSSAEWMDSAPEVDEEFF